jgi:hypothetical protein
MEQNKLDNTGKEGSNAPLSEFLDHLLTYQSGPKGTQTNIPIKVEKQNKTEITNSNINSKNEIKNYPTFNINSDIKIEGKYINYLF